MDAAIGKMKAEHLSQQQKKPHSDPSQMNSLLPTKPDSIKRNFDSIQAPSASDGFPSQFSKIRRTSAESFYLALKIVFSYLTKQDLLLTASLVCKKWKQLIEQDAALWSTLDFNDLPERYTRLTMATDANTAVQSNNGPVQTGRSDNIEGHVPTLLFHFPLFENFLEEIDFTPERSLGLSACQDHAKILNKVAKEIAKSCPHLRKLSLVIDGLELNTDLMISLAKNCPKLIHLRFIPISLYDVQTEAIQAIIDHLTDVEVLSFKHFVAFRNLSHINLDTIEAFFQKFGPSLTEINFNFGDYDGSATNLEQILKYSPNIQKISVRTVGYLDKIFTSCHNIDEMVLNGDIDDGLEQLHLCTKLATFVVWHMKPEIFNRWLDQFAKEEDIKLESLTLGINSFSRLSFAAYLERGKHSLKSVHINIPLSFHIQLLEQCTQLRTLTLYVLSRDSVSSIMKLTQIQNLTIHRPARDEGLDILLSNIGNRLHGLSLDSRDNYDNHYHFPHLKQIGYATWH
jgi:hypothetical protein